MNINVGVVYVEDADHQMLNPIQNYILDLVINIFYNLQSHIQCAFI